MGVADLRNAFNTVASPAFTCRRAFLAYERASEVEHSRLTFVGTDSKGKKFEVRSELIRAGVDPIGAARLVAQKLLDDHDRRTRNATAQGKDSKNEAPQ